MNIISICLIGIIATFLSLILKKYNQEYALAISLITGILIFIIILSQITEFISQIQELVRKTSLPIEYGTILLKSLGICFLTQFSSDICNDAGENALSSKIEIAGKIIMLIISLPLFQKVTNIAIDLIK